MILLRKSVDYFGFHPWRHELRRKITKDPSRRGGVTLIMYVTCQNSFTLPGGLTPTRDGIVKMGYGAQPHGTEGAEHIATLSSDSHQSID